MKSTRSEMLFRLCVLPLIFISLGGCDVAREWEEEVKLHDGKTVVVKRKVIKEFTAALGAPPYKHKESRISLANPIKVEWRGDLEPIAFDVLERDAFVVIDLIGKGGPCQRYGNPNPPFVYFRSRDGGEWERVDAGTVPPTLRQNLLLNWDRPELENIRRRLNLKEKESLNFGAPREIREFSPTDKQRQRFC
jgi:hypothetical protein